MDISRVSISLVRQITTSATQAGDASSAKMPRKALDMQASQAARPAVCVAERISWPGDRLGQGIDIKA